MGQVEGHLPGALPSVSSKDCPLRDNRHTGDRRSPHGVQAPEEKQ